jgi:hypothetical protein
MSESTGAGRSARAEPRTEPLVSGMGSRDHNQGGSRYDLCKRVTMDIAYNK